jgi:hypothetical protein
MMTPFRSLLSRTAILILAVGVTGCANRYLITTTSGAKIVTNSKPKRVENRFVYRAAGGDTNAISVLRVRSIEPYSRAALGTQPKVPELQ